MGFIGIFSSDINLKPGADPDTEKGGASRAPEKGVQRHYLPFVLSILTMTFFFNNKEGSNLLHPPLDPSL